MKSDIGRYELKLNIQPYSNIIFPGSCCIQQELNLDGCMCACKSILRLIFVTSLLTFFVESQIVKLHWTKFESLVKEA